MRVTMEETETLCTNLENNIKTEFCASCLLTLTNGGKLKGGIFFICVRPCCQFTELS